MVTTNYQLLPTTTTGVLLWDLATTVAGPKIDKQPYRLVGVVYRHPTKTNDEKCIEVLNETLIKIQRENKKVLLVGDFNFDLLKHETDANISNFLQMMLNNSYQPCITEPTRIKKKKKETTYIFMLIDLI